jgi:hypothetical protein
MFVLPNLQILAQDLYFKYDTVLITQAAQMTKIFIGILFLFCSGYNLIWSRWQFP